MLTDANDVRNELRLTPAVGAAVGAVLSVVMVAPLWPFLSWSAGFAFLAVQLGFIGGVYFGFAVSRGSVGELAMEFLVAGTFMFVGAIAFGTKSPVVLAAGYLAHAGWDAVHHPRVVTTPVRSWYPPFCAVFDLVVTAFILVRF
jgi:hypothetical protein